MSIDRPRGDVGYSLVEVLVTMMVVAMLGLAVVSTISVAARNSSAAGNRINATASVQTVTDRVTKYLRAAHLNPGSPSTAFTYADSNHVTFAADMADPTGARQVDLAVSGPSSGGTLTETTRLADTGTGPSFTYTGAPTSRVLTTGTLDTSGAALFTFYDPSGAVLTPPLTSAAATARIVAVRVTETLRMPGVRAPVTATTLVYLRNVQYR